MDSDGTEASAVTRDVTATNLDERSYLLQHGGPKSLYQTVNREESVSKADTITNEGDDDDATDPENSAGLNQENGPGQAQNPWGTLSILLLGTFVSQLDQSLVIATYGKVASEFHELDSGSWLISAYILAQCAVQPLYGKLSDVYSRKSCLVVAYVLFAIGTAGVGQSRTMAEVIAWRVVQGAGGSGMVSMVSIIITDIVPKNEIASMRSYVNVLQTTGRSLGGVIGGWMTQVVGWRWAFLIQVPPTVIAIILVSYALNLPSPKAITEDETLRETRWDKLRRVDFAGAFTLTVTILAICLVLDLGGQRLPWSSPFLLGILGVAIVGAIAFVIVAKHVKEPIFPLRLLTQRNVVASYAVILFATMAQLSLMTAVPIYFQVTAHASTAAAGAYLIPAFVGNTLGGLLAGYWIKRTGRYKPVTVISPLISIACMAILLLTWNGHTTIAGSLTIFLGGFAMGASSASVFVGLVDGVESEDVAVAASGQYLFFNIGAIAGVSAGSAASQLATRAALESSLEGFADKAEIIADAISNIDYIWSVKSQSLRDILIAAYVNGFRAVTILGAACSVLGFAFALISRGNRLLPKK